MVEDNVFYIVSDEYVEYLLKIESHVMQNKPQERTYHRKYVGVLTEINGFKYFVPMSSPKDKDYENGKIKKNNLTTIYIRSKKKLYGTLRFNSMIQVSESSFHFTKSMTKEISVINYLCLLNITFAKKTEIKLKRLRKIFMKRNAIHLKKSFLWEEL